MRLLLIIICIVFSSILKGQPANYNFHHLTAAKGLSDGVVRAIGQDKYGYIWVGTLSGLNRFNGYSVKTFYNNVKDSLSLPASTVRSILCDKKGRLWIGLNNSLVQFDYSTLQFKPVKVSQETGFYRMFQNDDGTILIITSRGMMILDPDRQSLQLLKLETDGKTLTGRINDIFVNGNTIFIAHSVGLLKLDYQTKKATRCALASKYRGVSLIAKDGEGNIWLTESGQGILVRTDTLFRHYKEYPEFKHSTTGIAGGSIYRMLIDRNKQLWCSSNINGLLKYDRDTKSFKQYRHDPLRQWSMATNHTTHLFEGRAGFLWIGTEGYGVDYFHPQANLFSAVHIPSQAVAELPSLWARSIVVDKNGNQWMAFGGGLVKTEPGSEKYRIYVNKSGQVPELHTNSVRTLQEDDQNNLWIGTADGLNRLDLATGKTFFTQGKDSLPGGFFWTTFMDSRKTVWFGTGYEILYKDTITNIVTSAKEHPILKSYSDKGARAIFEDSKGQLWFGLNGYGVLCYDPKTGKTRSWERSSGRDTILINNTVNSIVEDKKGWIWMASFTGLTAYDPQDDKFHWYTENNGLPSIKLSALMVDDADRIWIGSTKGLLLFDSKRKNFQNFDMQDGLPTLEFSDMEAYKTRDGRFIYPTLNGFVSFNPNNFRDTGNKLEVVTSAINITGQGQLPANPEQLNDISLKHDQNFFSVELTGFNFANPDQTWYAYKLEKFDKDWIYTKARFINYTNVPGGKYVFRYKATSDPHNWDVPEKAITIRIGTIFYKATWFWLFVLFLAGAMLYAFYKMRMSQQKRIYVLQSKTQALEKEKASVMYESLKQQLNPHFLFNSLTSLGSLIKIDQKLASDFLNGMSRIYRYILKSRDNEVVSLVEEIAFVQHYIQLQKTRFEHGFIVNIDVPEEYQQRKIAPVTLQNLIENAIKHNIIDDERPLVIDIVAEGDYLTVSNNLQRKNSIDTSNKQGLVNLRSLYRYLSDLPLEITETEKQFMVKIPLL